MLRLAVGTSVQGNKTDGRRGEDGPRADPSSGCFLDLALFLVVGFSFFFNGCGLETVTYYSPPSFSYGSNILTLTHNSANSSAFLGYDIYYRAYYSQSEADTARQNIENLTSSVSSTPESVLTQMTSTGFKRIYLASNPLTAPIPLLPVASGTAPTYTFQMPNNTQSTNWYFTVSTDTSNAPTETEIVRGLGISTNNSFNYQYAVGDIDYGSTTGAVTSNGLVNSVSLVFFAVAYGYDFTKLTSVYSFPQSLYVSVQYGPLPTTPQ
jgi:hypothetical protein